MNCAILLIAGLLIFSGCVSESENTKIIALEGKNAELENEVAQLNIENTKQMSAFKEYVAGAYHYTFAKEELGVAYSNYSVMLDTCNEPDNFQECYSIVSPFNGAITDSLSKSVSAYTLAEKKLNLAADISDNFLKEDIRLRLEILSLEKKLASDTSKASNAWKNYVVESDETKNDELYAIYENLTKIVADDSIKISKIGDQIDLLWEQNWYPTVEDSNSIN